MLLLCILTVVLPTVTLQCSPHTVSQPWTKTETYNHHHHHQTVENFFLDNRTIYNKIVEIEKRIEKIEEKENIEPPPKPEVPAVEEGETPVPNKEDQEKNCLSCPSKPPILDSCDTCVPVTVSPPFEYYACKAIEVKCGDGAKRLKISDSFQQNINGDQVMFECRKGVWVFIASHKEQKVDEISCLTM